MKELTSEEITELITIILEKIAFIFVEPAESEVDEANLFHSKISYLAAEESADLYISASQELVTELASNMLGVDADDVDAEVEGVQALNEFANIVCGEVIHALGGENVAFSQGIPEHVLAIESSPDAKLCTESAMESEDGEPLRIIVARSAL